MSKYTTGELAKLCNTTVRTVQFYDTKGLLIPSELSEGGRRLYSEQDCEKLKLICVLKSLGISLTAVKDITDSSNKNVILNTLLKEQSKQIEHEIAEKQKQLKAIEIIGENINGKPIVPINKLVDIDKMIESKLRYKKTIGIVLISGICLEIIEILTLVLWVVKGIWLPFALTIPVIIISMDFLIKLYYKNVFYVCPHCGEVFKSDFWEFFFANHTIKTRKLTCTHCKTKDWCIETYIIKE